MCIRDSVKTIRRRYLEGLELLADVLMAPGPAGPESESVDFWCPSASLELVSEPPRIELIETRTVVAELAGLRSAPVAWSSEADRAKASDQLRVYCLHGGLVSRESPSSTGGLWRGRVYFPRPLASGAVSYTHLDVYKRQPPSSAGPGRGPRCRRGIVASRSVLRARVRCHLDKPMRISPVTRWRWDNSDRTA